MNCDGKRNLCGRGSDAVNQQQKKLGVGNGLDLEWSGRFYNFNRS